MKYVNCSIKDVELIGTKSDYGLESIGPLDIKDPNCFTTIETLTNVQFKKYGKKYGFTKEMLDENYEYLDEEGMYRSSVLTSKLPKYAFRGTSLDIAKKYLKSGIACSDSPEEVTYLAFDPRFALGYPLMSKIMYDPSSKPAIIRVDISKLDFKKIYSDTSHPNNTAIFTIEDIPSSLIDLYAWPEELKKKTTDELIELSQEEFFKLDLDKEFWSVGSEIEKHNLKNALIHALSDDGKIVAILITQKNKKRIIALQSIKEGYGSKIMKLVIKKLGRGFKLKGAVRGAITFYYRMGFELDRDYMEVNEYNTINMKYCTKKTENLSPKERMDSDITFLKDNITRIETDRADKPNLVMLMTSLYRSTLGNLKMAEGMGR